MGLPTTSNDVQARVPATRLGLSRVGVTGVEKVIRISSGESEQLFFAELECFVDLSADQKGAHMSRFEEIVGEAIDEVVLRQAFRAETLAAHIAELVRDRQDGLRAEVRITARYPEQQIAPVSGKPTQGIYTMLGAAVASDKATRRVVGVEAQGMTACPCAQEMVAERARARLTGEGFTDDEIERVIASVPIATHNQRGLGTLHVGATEEYEEPIEASTLLEIVEHSMSSEIYELLKRGDEVEVVEKAHRRPRFVEDCVREMLSATIERFGGLGDGAFVSARQRNLETIHRHDVVAERQGTLGALRRELAGEPAAGPDITMREWLERAR